MLEFYSLVEEEAMNKFIIASMKQGAGKTSVIVGIIESIHKNFAYMKPFGDRIFYRKKRLWDYDFSVLRDIYELVEDPDQCTLGFDHSKMRYMYDEDTVREKLHERIDHIEDKELLFIEGGRDFFYGKSVHLDASTLAKEFTNSKLIVVVSGDEGTILDDCATLQEYLKLKDVNLGGIIINKLNINNLDDFNMSYLEEIKEMGINVFGVVPTDPELNKKSIQHLSESLFAKVVTGEEGLNDYIEHVLVGAMSADAVLRYDPFQKDNKLVITSGDRSDMILAALESHSKAILLTNNILPPANLISMATDKKIPLLLVPYDTFEAAKRVDKLEPLITKFDTKKREVLGELIKKYVDLDALLK